VVGAIAAWILLPPRALSFAGGRAVSLADYKGPSPVGVPAELRSGDLITRGKYLTQAADCEVCHTREGGEPFAGGRAFKTPFGVLYSPNITADPETGIGTWTDTDFVRAVHRESPRTASGSTRHSRMNRIPSSLMRTFARSRPTSSACRFRTPLRRPIP
jgi:hypothetical protein